MNKVGIAKRIPFPVIRNIISNNNVRRIIFTLLLKIMLSNRIVYNFLLKGIFWPTQYLSGWRRNNHELK